MIQSQEVCLGDGIASADRPAARLPRIVSLFSGAGGLDLGFRQAGFSIAVAVDSSSAAIRTHKRNFSKTFGIVADLSRLKPSALIKRIGNRLQVGERIAVIGGPPCQGFSRANTGAKSDDPRNSLPQVYLRVIRGLQRHFVVDFVLFENVLGMKDKKHAKTFAALKTGLENLSFTVNESQLCSLDFGTPQIRNRVVVIGLRQGAGYGRVRPRRMAGMQTVREAIGGLDEPAFFQRKLQPESIPEHPNHWTMRPKSARFTADVPIASDGRSFKRLSWDTASPTIAFGHREIHVHPNGRRRLSIFEAMRLQGFPDDFVLEGNLSEQVTQVSNAVPPPMARSLARALRRALRTHV